MQIKHQKRKKKKKEKIKDKKGIVNKNFCHA